MLIANGAYHYFRNGQRADVVETWNIQKRASGEVITHSERDAKEFGSFIAVESVERDGQITQFEVTWRNTSPNAIQRAQARYVISPGKISVKRTIEGEQYHDEYNVENDFVISPLMRIYTGKVIKEVERLGTGGGVTVLVPWILNPTDHNKLLTPIFDQRSAKWLSAEGEINKYQYVGGSYDDNAEFWLDPRDVMARYVWNEWDVQLTR